jgi:hypothetical protein
MIASSETSTLEIRDSTLTAVLMPRSNDCLLVPDNQTTALVQFARTEPMIPCKGGRSQSELGLLAVASHVDVHRLVAVETVKGKPVRARNARTLRHVVFVLGRIISGPGKSAKSG